MESIHLTIDRQELLNSLKILSVVRRKRFTSVLPIWLSFDPTANVLRLSEDQGAVEAEIPAIGEWPPAGATIDLYTLKRILEESDHDKIELHALEDAILFFAGSWNVRLNLLAFGPESLSKSDSDAMASTQILDVSSLPLFRWAHENRRKR